MKPAEWLQILRYFSLITWLGLAIAAGVWLGWQFGAWLQGVFGGIGWLVLGLILGVGGGFATVYSTLKKLISWE